MGIMGFIKIGDLFNVTVDLLVADAPDAAAVFEAVACSLLKI
jgi:hypothetical protein